MKIKYLAIVLVFVMMLLPNAAYAHNAEAVQMEGTVVLFQFDTGDPMYGAKLIVQDADGNELHKEFVKEDGLFDYGEYLGKADKIIVTDGGGHLVEFVITDEMQNNAEVAASENAENAQTEAQSQTKAQANSSEDNSSSSMIYILLAVVAVVIIVFIIRKNKRK